MARGRRAKAMIGAGGLLALAAGCNLVFGIEEGSPKPPDMTADATDEGLPPRVSPSQCKSDGDCVPPTACHTAHCDTLLGACTYVECETKDRACSASVCDRATATCGPAKDYGFRAGVMRASGTTLGCGTRPDACVAAVYPFVFIGTRDATVAVRVDSPVVTDATRVPIKNADFRPERLVVSGRRLWVLGAAQGTQAPYKLPIVAIDVPADPTVALLEANATVLDYPFATAEGMPAPNGRLFLVHDDPARGLPTAIVGLPLPTSGSIAVANPYGPPGDAGPDADGAPPALPPPNPPPTIPMFRLRSVVAATSVGASSGTRLVALRGPNVSTLNNAGTAEVAQSAEAALSPPFYVLAPPRFSQGPEGSALLGAPINLDGATPAGPECNCNSSARLQWLFAGAEAPAADVGLYADSETYTNPVMGACHACPAGYFAPRPLVATIDAKRALVAAPATEARALLAVRLVTRDPLPVTATKRRAVKADGNTATDRIALAASAGYGYLVTSNAEGNDPSITVFDPRCDAK